MDKVLRVIGIIVVAWIALGIVGWVFGFLVHAVFWAAIIAGGVYAGSRLANRNRRQVGYRR